MLLTETETAMYLKVSKATLQQWRFKKIGPPYVKITGIVRYQTVELETYISNNVVIPGRKGI
jgi:hypothetical protein